MLVCLNLTVWHPPPPYCTSALVSSLYDYHASLRYKLWASRPAWAALPSFRSWNWFPLHNGIFTAALAEHTDIALYLVGMKSEQRHLALWQSCDLPERTDPLLPCLCSWQLIETQLTFSTQQLQFHLISFHILWRQRWMCIRRITW